MSGPLDRRFVAVTGKGGVGRSTVAAALALAAARRGRRVCVAEMSGAWRIQAMFGATERSYRPFPLAPGVDSVSLTSEDCLDDFGRRKLRMGALVHVLLRSQALGSFLDAVPGLHDLQQLGKIENMLLEPVDGEPAYDLIVLDAPATGHAVSLLAAARAMREMTVAGPFHDLARRIELLVDDPRRTGLVLVTLPEALPVRETLELVETLGRDARLVDAIVVNQVRPATVPAAIDGLPWSTVRDRLSAIPEAAGHLTLADAFVQRQAAAERALARLQDAVGRARTAVVTCTLPHLERDGLTPADLAHLADELGALDRS